MESLIRTRFDFLNATGMPNVKYISTPLTQNAGRGMLKDNSIATSDNYIQTEKKTTDAVSDSKKDGVGAIDNSSGISIFGKKFSTTEIIIGSVVGLLLIGGAIYYIKNKNK